MNINKVIDHMRFLKDKRVKYSMAGSRVGTDGTADCSGALYAGLVKGGGNTEKYPPSTETLHGYLIKNGFELHAENRSWIPKTGDIFIWGKKGQSAGAGGHTGIFINQYDVIHCNYGANGVTIDDYQIINTNSGRMYCYIYRLKAANQSNNVGGGLKKMKTYTLDKSLPLMTKPSTKAGLIANLRRGDVVKFDDITFADGRLWACQKRQNGYGYIELAPVKMHGSIA